ncbi:MAG: hypothetical protein KDD68_20420, partial [Bdellovibrionales bacterium]|nr:hypothetical protein [Bdellovibrionales bacterium]
NSVMIPISNQFNWTPANADKIDKLSVLYYFMGQTPGGETVFSDLPITRSYRTSFNLRRSVNTANNYVANGCSGEYSISMSSYVSSKMAKVAHYLTNDLGVETLCNDGALPFGGRFLVNLANEDQGHESHRDGNHIDMRYFSDQDCSAFEGSDVTACNSYGNFKNYYDIDHAARRILDWDYTKEFLTALNGLSATAKQECLDDSSTCADAMAASDTGTGTLAAKKAKAQRNLNAMLRLARWTKYNRRKWTQVLDHFDGLYIIFSPGPVGTTENPNPNRKRWQQYLVLNGTVDGKKVYESSSSGGLVEIGSCSVNSQDPTISCDLTPEGSNSPTYRTKLLQGHYHHIHIGGVW